MIPTSNPTLPVLLSLLTKAGELADGKVSNLVQKEAENAPVDIIESPVSILLLLPLNFSAACTFTATASAAATFTFSGAVQGQVVDLIVTGNYALTFAETGSTFNRVGSTTYDGSATNLIQIVCTDDTSGAKIYHYSIATYTSAQPQ